MRPLPEWDRELTGAARDPRVIEAAESGRDGDGRLH